MVKVNLSDINVPELIADIWSPLNDEQREFLANHFTLQNYKKNRSQSIAVRPKDTYAISIVSAEWKGQNL